MTRLDEIKGYISERWGGDPAVDICQKILEFLVKNDPQKSQMLTYPDLVHIVGLPEVTADLERALSILAGRFDVLSFHLVFFNEDGEPHYLDPEEERDFFGGQGFSDPDSGEELENAAERLFPYYEANTEELLKEANR